MLDTATIALIKASVPALQSHGETITRHFYGIMFRDYPEVKAFFNQNHQAEGTQPRALANAVLAYASHIDRLDEIAGALPAIIHKHVSLGIRPDQYPIVGKCLLQAIGEVLGDAATPELVDAWAKAYQLLADLLIGAEEQLYQQLETQPGGWRGERSFTVIRKVKESDVITSFYLRPTDGGRVPLYQPGQYLALVLNINGETLRRNYSLSDAPGNDYLRISVKREDAGTASVYLHNAVNEGDTLQVLPPCGEFVLDESNDPLLLVAGGVGITPLMAMLKPALKRKRQVTLIHASRNSAHRGFASELASLASEHPNLRVITAFDEALPGDTPDHHGRIDNALLETVTGAQRDNLQMYLLGPKPFMQSVYQSAIAIGVPEARINVEFFGPKQGLTG